MRRLTWLVGGLAVLCVTPAEGRAQSFLGKDVTYWQTELAKKDPAVRRNAAFALGKIGPDAEEAIPALSDLASNANLRSTRDAAAKALEQIRKGGKAKEK